MAFICFSEWFWRFVLSFPPALTMQWSHRSEPLMFKPAATAETVPLFRFRWPSVQGLLDHSDR